MCPARTATLLLLAFGPLATVTAGLAEASVIYSDSFTAANGTGLVGRAPEVNNGVAGATYGQHHGSWEKDIQGNQARIGADTGVSLDIASSGLFLKPSAIRVSASMDINTINGSTTPSNTGLQRGVGLGFYAGTGGVATQSNWRGLLLGTDGRLILAQHGVAGSSRAGFLAEIATGLNTAVPHTLSYEIDTLTGDVANIILDGSPQPDVNTTVFNAATNRAGFMASANSGGTTAFFDDFLVEGLGPPPATIADLFNTGVDNGGVPLPDNVDDPHYAIIAQPSPGGLTDTTIPADGFPIPPWAANDADSRWIAPNTDNGVGPAGSYTYRTTFTVPAVADLSTVTISGLWGADDGHATLDFISLNDTQVATGNGGFGSLTPFNIGPGSPFVQGLNTLDFTLQNGGANPTGLRVDNLAGVFAVGIIPEPSTLLIWSLLAGLAFGAGWRRRKR